MRDVNRARDVLLDPAARADFDRGRRLRLPVQATAAGATQAAAPGREIRYRARARTTTGPRQWWDPRWAETAEPPRRERPVPPPDADASRDWYAFLGVSASATAQEVRAALGRKAMAMQGAGITASEVMRRNAELRACWGALGDPARRAAYDAARRQA
jgi:DnaJ-class molecular chaperone